MGFSKSFVASRIGIATDHLTAFEAGRAALEPALLAKLAAVLMVRVTWLFVDDGHDDTG